MIYEITNLKSWFLSIDGVLIRPGQMRKFPVLSEGAIRFASGDNPLVSIKRVSGVASVPVPGPEELLLNPQGIPAPKAKVPPPPPPKAVKTIKPPKPTKTKVPPTTPAKAVSSAKPESPAEGGNREEIILHEMRQMILEGKDLTTKGLPELPILNERLGNYDVKITLKERKKLFKKLNQ